MTNLRLDSRLIQTLFCGVLALLVLTLNSSISGPVIVADETSYLANAAAFAGYRNDFASSYHSGYSVLISAAFWFAGNPEMVWKGVQVVNAILYFATVFFLFKLAFVFKPNPDYKGIYIAVLIVALYPMWVITVGYSLAHNAFVPLYLLILLLLARSIETKNPVSWLVLGLFSGILYWIHPTALPVLVALLLSVFVHCIRSKHISWLIYTVIGLGISLLFYIEVLTPWLNGKMTLIERGARFHYPDASTVVSNAFSLKIIESELGNLGGHLLYLLIGTSGLAFLGFWTSFKLGLCTSASELKNQAKDQRTIYLFLMLSFLGVLALSIIFFPGTGPDKRLDHWMYGRYVEGVLAPLLLVALLNKERWRKLLFAIPLLALSVTLCVIFIVPLPKIGQPAHFSAFWPFLILDTHGFIFWGFIGSALLFLIAVLPRVYAFTIITFLFLSTAIMHKNFHNHTNDLEIANRGAFTFIREHFPPRTCIGFDPYGLNEKSPNYRERGRFFNQAGFVFFDYFFIPTRPNKWKELCDGPLISFDKNLLEDKDLYAFPKDRDKDPFVFVKKSQLANLKIAQ